MIRAVVRFPIRVKLLLLISGLILCATASYLWLAVKLFRDDKTSLVYELNSSTVKTLSAQTEAYILKIADKIQLLTQGHKEESWARAIFEAEPDLISYTLYAPPESGATEWRSIANVRNSEYLKLYGLPTTEVDRIREHVPIPFARVLTKRTWIANSTLQGGAPILTLALAIDVRDGDKQLERIAVADLRLDRILKILPARGISTAYIVDGDGHVIAHPDIALVTRRGSLGEVPIVREAVESAVATQIKTFEWNGETWLGAYSAVAVGGIKVISQVKEADAFNAARKLIQKSLLFALLVVTVGLLISRKVAHDVTEPITQLLEGTDKLARGEFSSSIHVRTHDEMARLARAFNAMASHLQTQRSELEQSHQELEIKVRERTEALETEKRRQAESQDALLRTTRLASLGELAGSAAHEVLNPINNMNIRLERLRTQQSDAEASDAKLLAEILEAWKKAYASGGWRSLETELGRPVEGGKQTLFEEDLGNLSAIASDLDKRLNDRREGHEFISKEITRVTRIINNMRALSRVGGERKPLDIHVPIDDTAVTLGDLLDKRKVELVKDYSADSRDRMTVIADKDELVQVFSNLIRNAMHALDAAKRRVPVIWVATARKGDRVEIRIRDNGTGIKAEHIARIFEPDFTTKSVEEGTGLGLSISRRLVRAFGGDLEVEQTVDGEGTTFLIWLPASS